MVGGTLLLLMSVTSGLQFWTEKVHVFYPLAEFIVVSVIIPPNLGNIFSTFALCSLGQTVWQHSIWLVPLGFSDPPSFFFHYILTCLNSTYKLAYWIFDSEFTRMCPGESFACICVFLKKKATLRMRAPFFSVAIWIQSAWNTNVTQWLPNRELRQQQFILNPVLAPPNHLFHRASAY